MNKQLEKESRRRKITEDNRNEILEIITVPLHITSFPLSALLKNPLYSST